MSQSAKKSLTDYRSEIDTLDDQIISLLKQRIGIVADVGRLKRSEGHNGLLVRSGREGAMVKRVYEAFQGSDFLPAAAAHIWRTMIAASIHFESPMSVSVSAGPDTQHLYWLAREYFGTFVPIVTASTPGNVISDVTDGKVNIGVLPTPDADRHWWAMLSSDHEKSPKIFAHIPAVVTAHQAKSMIGALALGCLMPEPSGDDVSYFSITLHETVSTSRLQTVFTQCNLKASFINSLAQPPIRRLLVQIEGFYDTGHADIAKLRAALPDIDIFWLGAHARVIVDTQK